MLNVVSAWVGRKLPTYSDKIVLRLEATAAELRAELPELDEAVRLSSSLPLYKALHSKTKFLAAVESEESFGRLRNGWISFATGGQTVRSEALAYFIVRSVLTGAAPGEVVSEVRNFAKIGRTDGYWFKALSGVAINAACNLREGVDLVPWDEVPECEQRRILGGAQDVNYLATFRPKPDCAIRIRITEAPALFESAHRDRDLSVEDWPQIEKVADINSDVVRALSVCARGPVLAIGSWAYAGNSVVRGVMGTSLNLGPAIYGGMSVRHSQQAPQVGSTQVRDIFVALNSFEGNARQSLRIAIDRISSAIKSRDFESKVIDIGIALEVILLHDQKESGELSYRLALRGARFLGTTKVERIANFKLLRRTYKLRSNAVHNGRADGNAENQDTVTSALEMLFLIVEKILSLNKFPDWEDDVIMNS